MNTNIDKSRQKHASKRQFRVNKKIPETQYLMQNPINAGRLLDAITEVENIIGKTGIS